MSKNYDQSVARCVRRRILDISYNAKVAHIPSALSMCDYLGVLFEDLVTPQTHRFVLGKPFGAQAYYTLFSYYGWIGDDLSEYGSLKSEWRYIIQREHPLVTFIDESMGNCLSVANGIALAGKKVFVNISDAAFQEGTVWESALFAGSKQLGSIIMAVDNNDMQALGRISSILDIGDLEKKLLDFGWLVFSCDGHNLEELHSVISRVKELKTTRQPIALVFKTMKGKGVPFMELDSVWHYGILDEESYQSAINVLL